jgi:hypothetical protein
MTPLGAFSVYWLVGQVLPADVVLGLHHKKRRSRVVYDLVNELLIVQIEVKTWILLLQPLP